VPPETPEIRGEQEILEPLATPERLATPVVQAIREALGVVVVVVQAWHITMLMMQSTLTLVMPGVGVAALAIAVLRVAPLRETPPLVLHVISPELAVQRGLLETPALLETPVRLVIPVPLEILETWELWEILGLLDLRQQQ
jgi:hypothetical protein